MAQRIAKITVGSVSIWDVHFPIKRGKVDFEGQLLKWLLFMRNEGNKGPDLPRNLSWVDSLRTLIPIFQKHIDDGSTVFKHVKALHFLKFSLCEKGTVFKRDFFAFNTPFDDPTEHEENYVEDMYARYGAMMEVVWRHCEGVTQLLEEEVDPLPDPPDPIGSRPQGFKLSDEFLDLVDKHNVDIRENLCFYNANPHVSSPNVETWKGDSKKLGLVADAVAGARVALEGPDADRVQILDALIKRFDEVQV